VFSQGEWGNGVMEIKVIIDNDQVAQKLIELKLDGDYYPGFARLYITQNELEKLNYWGINYEILIEDLAAYYKDFWKTRDAYHTYQEIIDLADSLEDNFPDICKKYLFGVSVQGRQLAALKISDNVDTDENEAEILFDGGIHGDEIGGAENLIRFARDLCLDYNNDPYITELIDNRETWLYLMVNPDGRELMTRENVYGVDLNRDWGYMWDEWGGSTGAYSQIESKGLRNCVFNNQFVIHTTYHSGTEVLGYPWSYRSQSAPDQPHIHHLAEIYVTESNYPYLEFGQANAGIYPINGSTKDSNYGIMGSVSWTMEISFSKQPPTNKILLYYDYNKPSMEAMIEHAGYGLEGIVTDANTGESVASIVLVNDYFQCYTDPESGDYHKYVLPGFYKIKVLANGYQSQIIDSVEVLDLNSTITNFQLTPDTGDFIYKIVSSQIPDNNELDEGNTPAVFGAPDSISYSIGKNGWIVLDMQKTILDGPGPDFIVFDGDDNPEAFYCFAGETMDGPWTLIGEGAGTTEFDLLDTGIPEIQYIKLLDNSNDPATGDDIGFDLDAIEVPETVSGVYLTLYDHFITDESGNNNGRIDPGETIDLYITLRNNGDFIAEDIYGEISTEQTFVTIDHAVESFGDLDYSQTSQRIYTFSVSDLTPNGYTFQINLDVVSNNGSYTNYFPLNFSVGQIIEDWESADFDSFNWEQGGAAPWIITETGSFEGNYAAQSGNINDLQSSELSIGLDVTSAGTISFYRRVSSESTFDFLKFYIDDLLMDSWSGDLTWENETYEVMAGIHEFKWVYSKDNSQSNGSDCGWIDYIVFPPIIPEGMGVVNGTVIDFTTGLPIPGALIGGVISTDSSGHYEMDLMPGEYEICASHDDYETLCLDVLITESDTATLNFELIPTTGIDENIINDIEINTYPNPIVDKLTIEFEILKEEAVLIELFNINGKRIKLLAKNRLKAGFYKIVWDGLDENGIKVSNGLYFYKLSMGNRLKSGKIIVSH